MTRYNRLFAPITIRNLTIRNRIIMSAHDVGVGLRSKRAVAYYTERAQGGVGAIIAGMSFVEAWASEEAWGQPEKLASFIEGCKLMTAAVRDTGARIGVQLALPNRFPGGRSMLDTKGEPVAPSHRTDEKPKHILLQPQEKELRALTIAEIRTLIALCGKAAGNTRKAGFEFVELHLANGYLACQFFSPRYNQRDDEFGGDLNRRMRFALECVGAMRAAVGQDFPIFVRLGAAEEKAGGTTISDSVLFARQIEAAGVDALNVSTADRRPGSIPTGELREGFYLPLAEAIKRQVKIPVIAVGQFHTPAFVENVLARQQADMVAMARQLIADPSWPNKAKAGMTEDIVPCLVCSRCIESVDTGEELQCSVNARAGREATSQIQRAGSPKKVLIVGGGPGGMEAARVAALRGHQVTLLEKAHKLGGSLLLLAMLEPEITSLIRYYTRQLQKLAVSVKLHQEVTPEVVDALKPDALIVATGGSTDVPEVTGLNHPNVMSATDIREALHGHLNKRKSGWRWRLWDAGFLGLRTPFAPLLTRWVQRFGIPLLGKRVIVIGGGLPGCQIGAFLAKKGKKVTLLEEQQELGIGIPTHIKEMLEVQLRNGGARIETKVRLEEITAKGVRISRDGTAELIEGDTVILAKGMKPNTELGRRLQEKYPAASLIGDCSEPKRIGDAVAGGLRAAREL